MKELSEMSKEELWKLFPIYLTEHKEVWKDWYLEEKKILEGLLPSRHVIGINHIGSTSIETIWAKSIVDILVELASDYDMEKAMQILVQNGYICMSQSKERISLNKGYTKEGFAEKVFHIHLRYQGDIDEIYFRDYLINNEEAAKEYEKLKLSLWKKFEHDRDGYTNAKTELVIKYTQIAKQGEGK